MPFGEFGAQSVYYLTDGAGSVRHLVDPNGAVKLARMYEPFGQVLMQAGAGDPMYGYLGAQFDRISGLQYINGTYYDPVTGRFLSPSIEGSNPYVPLGGAALTPILILALIGRRKKGKIWTGWLVVALMVSAGLTVAACGGQPTPARPTTPVAYTPPPKNPTLNIYTPTPTPISTGTSAPPLASQLPPVLPDCPTPPATPTLFIGTPTPIPPTPNCTPTDDEPYCINPAVDDLRTMVTHVIYKEAGILGQQGMRNVAQVISNRVGAPGFADTILGVISQGNGIHFNGWRAPAPRTGNTWSRALETADLLLNGSPLSPSPGMESSTVRFFHSCDASLTMEDQYVHKDEGGGRVQFYFDHEPNRQCVAPTPALSPTP